MTTDTTLELRTSRVLPATPEQVFDAYTDAEKQTTWFSILDETPGWVGAFDRIEAYLART